MLSSSYSMSDREEHDSSGSDQDQLNATRSEDDVFYGKQQVPGQTHQVPVVASGSKSIATEIHAESHTLLELQKTNELLVQLVGRVKKTERRVRGLEDIIISTSGPSSSSSGSTPKRSQPRRKVVPPEVRVSIICLCIMYV